MLRAARCIPPRTEHQRTPRARPCPCTPDDPAERVATRMAASEPSAPAVDAAASAYQLSAAAWIRTSDFTSLLWPESAGIRLATPPQHPTHLHGDRPRPPRRTGSPVRSLPPPIGDVALRIALIPLSWGFSTSCQDPNKASSEKTHRIEAPGHQNLPSLTANAATVPSETPANRVARNHRKSTPDKSTEDASNCAQAACIDSPPVQNRSIAGPHRQRHADIRVSKGRSTRPETKTRGRSQTAPGDDPRCSFLGRDQVDPAPLSTGWLSPSPPLPPLLSAGASLA
mgnify:CR=1 FL=1